MQSALAPQLGIDGTFKGFAESPYWSPPILTDDERTAIAAQVRFYETELLPLGDGVAIAGRLRSLLAHWDRGDRDEVARGVREAVAADWIRRLGHYPLWAICMAADEWLDTSRQRPTIADIRLLCDRAVAGDLMRLRIMRRALAQKESAAD